METEVSSRGRVEIILYNGRDRLGGSRREIKKIEIVDCIRLRHPDIRPGPLEPHEMAVGILDFPQRSSPMRLLIFKEAGWYR